jgi:hypothetical protein
MTWTSTIHCRSRAHCRACRTDPAWRAQAGAPDVCPIGLPIDAKDGYPAILKPQASSLKPAVPLCSHQERTAELVPHRPCCVWIVCHNPRSPIRDQSHTWRSNWCVPEKCRFYEPL